MKYILRLMALLLTLCLLVTSLSSCLAYIRIMEVLSEETEAAEGGDGGEENQPDADANVNPYLQFTLTEDDEIRFYELLEKCEELTMVGTDSASIERAWVALEKQYYHIGTQVNIARILYDQNLKNEKRSENYLFASELIETVYQSYMELCQAIDASNSPYRDTFFEDWTDEQLSEMRSYTEQVSNFKLANEKLMMDARELDVKKDSQKYRELYREFVKNNNQMARALGYSNYYAYATKDIYMRDFGPLERRNLRLNVKNYLVPLCKKALEMYEASVKKLSNQDRKRLGAILDDAYNELPKDYIALYLERLGGSTEREMESLFDANNSIFSDSSHSYEGAYTAYLYEYERPLCYFGPSYQNSWTVIHEMGHFYAAKYMPYDMINLDIAELHSQGNEMLFLAQLEDELDQLYQPVVCYQLYSMLANIIVATIIDDFEEQVYCSAITSGVANLDFEDIMDMVEQQYGGVSFVSDYITDMTLYWKYVAIESPVYYLSYATSGVVALSLYADARQNFDGAVLSYRKLCEETIPMSGFLQALTVAGLDSPFQRVTYEDLRTLLPQ